MKKEDIYESLWDLDNNVLQTTDNIKDILEKQSKYLSDKTNGAVHADLCLLCDNIHTLARSLNDKSTVKNDISHLRDAEVFYSRSSFGYELYNDEYRFRIFEIDLSPLYPVNVSVDEDIFRDILSKLSSNGINCSESEQKCIINSDEEFLFVLGLILSNRKVKLIIKRMMENTKTEVVQNKDKETITLNELVRKSKGSSKKKGKYVRVIPTLSSSEFGYEFKAAGKSLRVASLRSRKHVNKPKLKPKSDK